MAAVPLEAAIGELGAKRAAEGGLTADCVLETIGPGFTSLLDLLPSTDTPAVIPVDARAPCTHARLRRFVEEIGPVFWRHYVGRNDRVAILLPNGPELAVAFVAVLSYCTCAPLNPANTPQEIMGELKNVGARAMIIMAGEDNDELMTIAEQLDIRVLEATVAPDDCAGIFTLVDALAGLRYAHAGETPQPLHRLGSDEMLVPAEDFTVARQLDQLLPFTTEALGCTSRWSRYFGGVARIGTGHNSV